MKKNRAFTLIELLVVIAIIALLLSILLPSLKLAKDIAKRTICLSHIHSLGVAWVVYAEENDERICNAKTARITETSSNPRKFQMTLTSYHNEPSWVGWFGEPRDSDNNFIIDEVARQACVKLGSLYPYNETLDIYVCPSVVKKETRVFAIVDAMNGHDQNEFADLVVRKRTELKVPGNRLVFVDEGWVSTESWTIWPDRIQWWDSIPLRHGEGTTFGMADGSSEYWKWKDQRTIDFANGQGDPVLSAQDNEDFMKLYRAAWGKSPN